MNSAGQLERQHVLDRDRFCVLFIRDPEHACHRMGFPHRPSNKRLLTVEHVKDNAMMGKRAPSDRRHMVAMCFDSNVAVPSKAMREWIREYLRRVEP